MIGFANAGTDLQNCLKQAAEFQLAQGGLLMATLLMAITDVNALGIDVCQGLVLTNSFYWDLTDKTRAWSKRYTERSTIRQPCSRPAATPACCTI